MDDKIIIEAEDEDDATEGAASAAPTKAKRELTPEQREAKIKKDRERRAAKKVQPAVADKRLEAALILHNVPEVEAKAVVAKRRAEQAEKPRTGGLDDARKAKAERDAKKAKAKATTMPPKKTAAKPAAKPKDAKKPAKATKVAAKPKKGSKTPAKAARMPSTAGDGKPLIMKHSYQRFGKVATGVEIKGGGRQTVVTFPKDMFKKVAIAAKANGVSFSEQVRRYVLKSVGA